MANNNCSSKRIIDPAGIWSPEDIIGAIVKVHSSSISNFLGGFDCSVKYTVESVQFRISTDGKAITLIKLKDLDATFTLKDLIFTNIVDTIDPITGETTPGFATCNE